MSLARLAASLLALMICAGVAYAIDPEDLVLRKLTSLDASTP